MRGIAPSWWYLLGGLGLLCGVSPGEAQHATAPAAAPQPVEVRTHPWRASGLHLEISRAERRIRLKDGSIVLHDAPAGVGKGGTLEHDGKRWEFSTPAGERIILAKEEHPVWVPPDWHYVELARERGLQLVRLEPGADVSLADGSRISLRGGRAVRLLPDGSNESIPTDEEIVYGDTLVVPPIGSANRRIPRELGRYKLDLGNGYLIHGTPREDSVGDAVTHGCIRLREVDLELLYRAVPVGTPVYIY